jgi:hypothetical protein
MNGLRDTGFTGNEYIISSGAAYVLVLDRAVGDFVCIPAPAFEGEEEQIVIRGLRSEISAVDYEPLIYTRFGGATRTVYHVRIRHRDQTISMEFPGKWRAKRAVKKLNKFLAGKSVVTEKKAD